MFITTDLLGLPKEPADEIRDRLEASFGLSRAQILLSSSHAHAGPEVDAVKFQWRVPGEHPDHLENIEQYVDRPKNDIVSLFGEALNSMEPARIYAGNGVTRFAVNRCNNAAASLHEQTQLYGPHDHAVAVLKAEDQAGDMNTT